MVKNTLCFSRFEKKYLLTARQYSLFSRMTEGRLVPDAYPHSSVCSLYYDDESFSMIRSSIEKPAYKEKLRIRSYGLPGDEDAVFVELKKKLAGTVYKRRVCLSARDARAWLAGEIECPGDSVTHREISNLLAQKPLAPSVFIVCDRLAFVSEEDPGLRVTFDRSIRYRDYDLYVTAGLHGEELLRDGRVLMEIKLQRNAPLWLSELLSQLQIFPTAFSKYGTCYTRELLPKYYLQNV